jgi:hypothetical protein
VTYKSKRALEEKYDISASLTNKLLDEMRQAGIYGQFKIVSDSFLRINAEAFDHFIKNRHAIKHGLKYEPYKEVKE